MPDEQIDMKASPEALIASYRQGLEREKASYRRRLEALEFHQDPDVASRERLVAQIAGVDAELERIAKPGARL